MKSWISSLIFTFLGAQAFAMGTLQLEGKLLRVQNKVAIFKSDQQELKIPMKKLSKIQAQRVLDSSGNSKKTTIYVTPEVLKKTTTIQ